jgi:plasmid stabilization system protein ParE
MEPYAAVAGRGVVRELRDAIDLIARALGTGRAYPNRALPGIRRVPLHRTRFHVYYILREDALNGRRRLERHSRRGAVVRLCPLTR